MDEFNPRENRMNGDFNPGFGTKPHKTLKEKNLYILHLDSPRIIIISCVMIGLIVVSLLIGMNINKFSDKEKDIFANDSGMLDNLLSGGKSINPMENSLMESPVDEKEDFAAPVNPLGDAARNNASALPSDNMLSSNLPGKANPVITADEDILTHENIESIIPPSNFKPASSVKSVKEPEVKKAVKSKKTVKKPKKTVVEVASKRDNPNTAPEVSGDYFSVQVASFDSREKANTEARRLKDRKYDSFVDTANVDGKKFYRVRIGPVYSMKKACALLDEITEDERYENSYIVKK